jgi:cyclase
MGMIDGTYKVIPGHGVLSTRADVKNWHDMLVEVRASVKKLADVGKPLEAIQQAKLTAKWDDRWGKGSIKPNDVVEFAFSAVKGKH